MSVTSVVVFNFTDISDQCSSGQVSNFRDINDHLRKEVEEVVVLFNRDCIT